MSHSENDMNKQVKRHKGPLIGFIAILVFVAVLLVWWIGREVEAPDGPTETPAQMEGSTSAPVDAAPGEAAPQSPVETTPGTAVPESQVLEPGDVPTTAQTPVEQ